MNNKEIQELLLDMHDYLIDQKLSSKLPKKMWIRICNAIDWEASVKEYEKTHKDAITLHPDIVKSYKKLKKRIK